MKLTSRLKIRSFIRKHLFIYSLYRVFQHRNDTSYLEMASLKNAPVIFKRENNILKVGNKKTYYILNFEWKTNGFFAIMKKALSAFAIAEEMGWIPYIDIQNSLYNVPGGFLGKTNMFEYYFNGINEKTLEKIKEEDNYVTSSYLHILEINRSFGLFDDDQVYSEYEVTEDYLKYLGGILKKYFVLRYELQCELDREIKSVICGNKVIGVHYRGTDFNAGRHGHPKIGSIEEYFKAIDELLKKGYDCIFLATDDLNALKLFMDRYGELICYFKDVERSSSENGVHLQRHDNEDAGYYLGREVLRDMMALTYCDGLVAGLSQVSIFARIQKYSSESKYEDIKIINNGIHQNDSKKAKEYYNRLYKSDLLK